MWPSDRVFDVVVASATPAGCAAALSAARSGCSVLLIEPTAVVGGMHSNGVHAFDTASMEALGGICEEFAGRVRSYYARQPDALHQSASDVYWESKVAQAMWQSFLDECPGITLARGMVPVGVRSDGAFISEIVCEAATDAMGGVARSASQPVSARGTIYIDASYEGDVAAWAGVKFRLGREPRSAEEPHAGLIYTTYLDRMPIGGVLPNSILPGSTGVGDDSLMAFNCRLACRIYPAGQHRPVAAPNGYDPTKYAWDRERFLPDGVPRFGTGLIPSVNGKMLLNVSSKGNDLVGPNRDYVLAHPYDRGRYRKRFIDHALGFLHFIQTEGKTPELGVADDEYIQNGNIPFQIYVREGRRVVGDIFIDEGNINPFLKGDGYRPPLRADSIAIGDWAIESKKCRDTTDSDRRWPEGLMHFRGIRAPYQIPYGALIPSGQSNLLVTCAISASHIAYCATRVESVWTQIGAAAGCAAALAVRAGKRPSEIETSLLQDVLLDRGGKLAYLRDVQTSDPSFVGIQWAALRGFVPHDRSWRFFPDRLITQAEWVELIVRGLAIPLSVSGAHFEGVDSSDYCFRYVETLYDLGSREAVAIFAGMGVLREDESADHHRPELKTRWLSFDPQQHFRYEAAHDFLLKVAKALGCHRIHLPLRHESHLLVSRGEACRLVRDLAVALKDSHQECAIT